MISSLRLLCQRSTGSDSNITHAIIYESPLYAKHFVVCHFFFRTWSFFFIHWQTGVGPLKGAFTWEMTPPHSHLGRAASSFVITKRAKDQNNVGVYRSQTKLNLKIESRIQESFRILKNLCDTKSLAFEATALLSVQTLRVQVELLRWPMTEPLRSEKRATCWTFFLNRNLHLFYAETSKEISRWMTNLPHALFCVLSITKYRSDQPQRCHSCRMRLVRCVFGASCYRVLYCIG